MIRSAEGLWIQMVPRGYYIDGCNPDLEGGIVHLTRTREYATYPDERGLWAIGRRIGHGFTWYSTQRFDSAVDAARALHRGGLKYQRGFINDIYKAELVQ